jgi:hypothetical protein
MPAAKLIIPQHLFHFILFKYLLCFDGRLKLDLGDPIIPGFLAITVQLDTGIDFFRLAMTDLSDYFVKSPAPKSDPVVPGTS